VRSLKPDGCVAQLRLAPNPKKKRHQVRSPAARKKGEDKNFSISDYFCLTGAL